MKKKTSKFEINSDKIRIEFERQEPLFKELCGQAVFILEKKLGETSIKIHSIPFRVKKLKSFLDKIDRYQIENPFEEINDLVGLRVICLFLSDIEKIGEIIRKNFEVIREDDKIDKSSFTSFGYLSVHFTVKLGDAYKKTIYADISNMPFEIQVRTIAMDAWANISHYLDYKTDQDIPKELKRDFYALNGMFYVADKHFQLFFEQRKEKQEEIAKVFAEGTEDEKFSQQLNLDTLTEYLKDKFPTRESGSSSAASELIDDLQEMGCLTINDVDRLINKAITFTLEFERDEYHGQQVWNQLGVLRYAMLIANDYYYEKYIEDLTKDGYKPMFNLEPYRKNIKK